MGAGFRVRLGVLLICAPLFFLVSVAQPVAQGELPAALAAEIAAAAEDNRVLDGRDHAIGSQLRSAPLAQTIALRHRQATGARMGAVVVNAIATHPALVEDIVAAAIAAAPESEARIVAAARAAFPAFAERIATAARGGPRVRGGGARPTPVRAAPRLPEVPNDPLEGLNRITFAVNDVLDLFVLRPIAALYGFVTPQPMKDAIWRAFTNLGAPVVLANDLLQLDLPGAAETAGRFAVNSTVGVAGLFDVAARLGLEKHEADFGQTLFSYGVGPGPYLVLPVLGPSTLRDGTGAGVDVLLNPHTYVFDTGVNLSLRASAGIVERESLLVSLEELRRTSVDYYSALRAAYYQNRALALGGDEVPAGSNIDAMFDAAE